MDVLDGQFDGIAGADIAQSNPRAGARGIARRDHIGQRRVRDHAEHHRMLGADMCTKRPGEGDMIDMGDAHLVHQKARTGIQRRLGKLDRADIALRDADLRPASLAAIIQDKRMRPPLRLAPGRAHLFGAADQPALIDDPRHPHLGHRLDDARSADAGNAGLRRRRRKARIVRPQV